MQQKEGSMAASMMDCPGWMFPIGLLLDKDTRLQMPTVDINTMGNHVIQHINYDNGGGQSLQNVGYKLHSHMADHPKLHWSSTGITNTLRSICKSLEQAELLSWCQTTCYQLLQNLNPNKVPIIMII
jgi:hypothetical protein